MKIYLKFIIILVSLISCSKKDTTINTFAVNDLRTASLESLSVTNEIKSITPHKALSYKDATKAAPLFVQLGYLKKNCLCFGRKTHEYQCVETEGQKVVFKTMLKGSVVGTPYFNVELQHFYILTLEAKDDSFFSHFFTLDNNGKILDRIEIDRSEIFSDLVKYINPNQVTFCKTSVASWKNNDKFQVAFGCSMKTQTYSKTLPPIPYANMQGLTGLVINLTINRSGQIERPLQHIKMSQPIQYDPYSGYDTGIYNSGAAFPVYKNHIWVSTGNGPVQKESNFGCSIINLLTEKNNLKMNDVLYSDNLGYNECHALNADLTSSAVTLSKTKTDLLGIHVDKYGVLRTFNPEKFKDGFLDSKLIANHPHYGQGASRVSNNKINYWTHWHLDDVDLGYENILPKIHEKSYFQFGYKFEKCIGAIKKPIEDALTNTSLYNSGARRQNILALNDDIFQKIITSSQTPVFLSQSDDFPLIKKFWPNFYITNSHVGNFYPKGQGNPLYLYKFEHDNSLHFYVHTQNSKALSSKKAWKYQIGYFRAVRNCSDVKNNEIAIAIYKKEIKTKSSWGLKKFSINNDGRIELLKTIYSDNKFTPSRAGITLLYNEKNNIIFFAGDNGASGSLFIYDEKNNSIRKIPLSGLMHFSMPVVTNQYIFAATENGLDAFKILFK